MSKHGMYKHNFNMTETNTGHRKVNWSQGLSKCFLTVKRTEAKQYHTTVSP